MKKRWACPPSQVSRVSRDVALHEEDAGRAPNKRLDVLVEPMRDHLIS